MNFKMVSLKVTGEKQKRIQNLVKHRGWSKLLTVFAKRSILVFRQGSEHAYE